MKITLYLKHLLSCLADHASEVCIDEAHHEVRLCMATFDSSLVAAPVTPKTISKPL
jgi:hypothetical protein